MVAEGWIYWISTAVQGTNTVAARGAGGLNGQDRYWSSDPTASVGKMSGYPEDVGLSSGVMLYAVSRVVPRTGQYFRQVGTDNGVLGAVVHKIAWLDLELVADTIHLKTVFAVETRYHNPSERRQKRDRLGLRMNVSKAARSRVQTHRRREIECRESD